MPVESIEITLIFFIMFVAGSSMVYLFLNLQNSVQNQMQLEILHLVKNKIFLGYLLSKSNPSTVIKVTPSNNLPTSVIGNTHGVIVQIGNRVDTINVTDLSGIGYDTFYIYNDNGTLYIV